MESKGPKTSLLNSPWTSHKNRQTEEFATPKMFYAVAVGRHPEIYKSWAEAEQQVDSFQGNKYKKFKRQIEAEAYMKQYSIGIDDITEALDDLTMDSWIGSLKQAHGDDLVAFCSSSAPLNGKEGCSAAYATYFPLETIPLKGNAVKNSPTNNRADCLAAQEATEIANEIDPSGNRNLVIYTLYQGLAYSMADHDRKPRWINKWQRNGWLNSDNTPVANRDIFQVLLTAESDRMITWHHINLKKEELDPLWMEKLHDQAHEEAERVARSLQTAAAN